MSRLSRDDSALSADLSRAVSFERGLNYVRALDQNLGPRDPMRKSITLVHGVIAGRVRFGPGSSWPLNRSRQMEE